MTIRSCWSTRRLQAVLNIYNIILAALPFATPWLFAYTKEVERWDMWIVGGAIMATGLLAIVMYSAWDEWVNACIIESLADRITLDPWLRSYARHTLLDGNRRCGDIYHLE